MEKTNIDVDELRSRMEDAVREAPGQSAAIALAAGFVLALLPIGAIIGGVLRLALHMLKPALLVLGLMKAWEEYGSCCGGSESDRR